MGCSDGLVVASLEETWGLFSRFDCVYSLFRLHHSRVPRRCSGGCYEPTCQVRLFPYTRCIHHSLNFEPLFSRTTFVTGMNGINASTMRQTIQPLIKRPKLTLKLSQLRVCFEPIPGLDALPLTCAPALSPLAIFLLWLHATNGLARINAGLEPRRLGSRFPVAVLAPLCGHLECCGVPPLLALKVVQHLFREEGRGKKKKQRG